MATICLQCGDKGWSNAYIYCINCLEVVVHRYCLDQIPKTFDEFVPWVCDFCEKDSTILAHQKSSAKEVGRSGSECTGVSSEAKSNNNSITPMLTVVEMVHSPNRPLLESANGILDSGEDSEIAGGLKADNDSNLMEVMAKEQECQLGSSQESHEPSAGEVVANVSPMSIMVDLGQISNTLLLESANEILDSREGSQIVGDMKADNDSNVIVTGHKPQVGEVVAYVSPPREQQTKLVEYSSTPNTKTKSSRKKKVKSHFTLKKKVKKLVMPVKDEKEVVCFYCKKKGHLKRNCNEYLASVKQQKANGEQGFRSLSSNQTYEARMPLQGPDHEREAQPRNQEVSQFPMGGHDCLAQPLLKPIWRGSFNLLNNDGDALEGFVAHLSNRACQKAYEEAVILPSLLNLTVLPKAEVWPKSFLKSEPTDDNIALYIFPADRRYERTFDLLVEDMRRREFAMRASVKNADLLIFTSPELPMLYWRFQNKYYLWGVFLQKQAPSSNAVKKHIFPNPPQDRINESAKFPSYVNNIDNKYENSYVKTCDAMSPPSSIRNIRSFRSRNY